MTALFQVEMVAHPVPPCNVETNTDKQQGRADEAFRSPLIVATRKTETQQAQVYTVRTQAMRAAHYQMTPHRDAHCMRAAETRCINTSRHAPKVQMN